MLPSLPPRTSALEAPARVIKQLTISPVPGGWLVTGEWLPRDVRFPTREQAIGFARHWASDHRPSLVTLELAPGEATGEWHYDGRYEA